MDGRRGVPLQANNNANANEDDRLVDNILNDESLNQSQIINLGGTPAPIMEDDDPLKMMGKNLMGSEDSSFKYNSTKDQEERESTHFMTVFEYFDASFLVVICTSNFAQGFRRLLELGLYYVFKDKLGLQPGEVTLLLGIMAFPWVAKIFLAIFSDNVTCCGSRRKSYLIINGSVNIFALILLMLFGIMYGKVFIMFCIILS